jgi:hypothetical protein
MKWIRILIVAPVWGLLAARLAMQSVLFLLGFFASVAGLIVGRVKRQVNALNAAGGLLFTALWGGLLYLAHWVVSQPLAFSYSGWEGVVFWTTASLATVLYLSEFPEKLRGAWRRAFVPGAAEASIFLREMSEAVQETDASIEVVSRYGAVLSHHAGRGRLYPQSALPARKSVLESALIDLATKGMGDEDVLANGYRELAFFVSDEIASRERELWPIVKDRGSPQAIEHLEEYLELTTPFQEEAARRAQAWPQLLSDHSP